MLNFQQELLIKILRTTVEVAYFFQNRLKNSLLTTVAYKPEPELQPIIYCFILSGCVFKKRASCLHGYERNCFISCLPFQPGKWQRYYIL